MSSILLPSHEVLVMWLNGLTVDEALELTHRRHPPQPQSAQVGQPVTGEYLARSTSAHILSQYRNFALMEHYLHKPRYFGDQFLFPMPASVKRKIIELYYDFDENVVRELMRKKLNYRSRKDLDDVCVKCKVTIGSCRRQFDNLKRISKRVEDLPGGLINNVEKKFLIPRELASKYAHVIFLTTNRIDTGKKKLSQFTFADFEYCSAAFMKYWTLQSPTSIEEFDLRLAQDAREIKAFFSQSREAFDDFRNLVFMCLSSKDDSNPALLNANTGSSFPFAIFAGLNTSITAGVGNNSNTPPVAVQSATSISKDFASIFKNLIRATLSLGSGFMQPKEVRDIFVDLLEKVVEPCVSAGWRGTDAEMFFNATREVWPRLTSSYPALEKHNLAWERLQMGVQVSALRLFNDLSVALSSVK